MDRLSKAALKLWKKLDPKLWEQKTIIQSEIERTRAILKRKQDKENANTK